MIYLLPRDNPFPEYEDCFGFLNSPRGGMIAPLKKGVAWALDNNCFTMEFDEDVWVNAVKKFAIYADTCLFVVAPDAVGDKHLTLDRFHRYSTVINLYNYPTGIAIQDGMSVSDVPWNMISAIFLGGTDEYKLGKQSGLIIREAIYLGKHVHIGRVNSRKRIMRFWFADSVDGTNPVFGPSTNIPRLAKAVREANTIKKNQLEMFPYYFRS